MCRRNCKDVGWSPSNATVTSGGTVLSLKQYLLRLLKLLKMNQECSSYMISKHVATTLYHYTIVHKYSGHVTSENLSILFPTCAPLHQKWPNLWWAKAQPMKHPNPLPVPGRLHLVGQRDDSPKWWFEWLFSMLESENETPFELEDIQGYNMLLIIGLGFRQ